MTKRPLFAAIRLDLLGLGPFAPAAADPLFSALSNLAAAAAEPEAALAAWAGFSTRLAEEGSSWPAAVARRAAAAVNAATLAAEAGAPAPSLAVLGRADLERFGRLAAVGPDRLAAELTAAWDAEGPAWTEAAAAVRAAAAVLSAPPGASSAAEAAGPDHPAAAVLLAAADWAAAWPEYCAALRRHGAGDLGRYRTFVWRGGPAPFEAVRRPDPIGLADLTGYEEQRALVQANTDRFRSGGCANNLLLYGDRGTGKSATVKAVCAAAADLRLVEVRKADLTDFRLILDTLAARPVRFVVFIDDLAFEATDDAYTGLKALLEGGAAARPDNVVVYATSNRRHLVKEGRSGRPGGGEAAAGEAAGGEARAYDSVQEQLSLADRFGVTVVFSAPDQAEYLRIAEFLAERRGLFPRLERAAFRADALRWERWFNGRSPRTARQYVDWIAGGADFPWTAAGGAD